VFKEFERIDHMIVHIACVTRNRSVSVSTLHTLLSISTFAYTHSHQLEIHFVNGTRHLPRLIKTADHLLWIEYGRSIDVDSFDRIFDSLRSDILVFPAVTGEVHWDKFKDGVLSGSVEPIEQMGLTFDTTVDNKISDGLYTVKHTVPSVFLVDCKNVERKMRSKKGFKIPRDTDLIFEKFKEIGVKVHAWTPAKVTIMETYECIGNIMNTPLVSFAPN